MNSKKLLFYFLFFAFISIITLYSSTSILASSLKNIYIKQLLIYVVCLIIFLKFNFNDFINKNILVLYVIGLVSLICLILFAEPINNARCWFKVPFLGTIQPSEFIKIIIVVFCANILVESKKYKFFKVFLILIIPSILTYLQPDTGLVLIYFIGVLGMIICYTSKYKYLIISSLAGVVSIFVICILYFKNQSLLISIFGDSIFLRIERLINWQSQTGFQLNNALISMGATGLDVNFKNILYYFPEAQNDFIFASFASSFGLVFTIILVLIFICFDIYLLNIALKAKESRDKLIIIGFFSILLYQQVQNMGMTLGLLPITGITLPFISYGGSSLLSYTLMLTIIKNIKRGK